LCPTPLSNQRNPKGYDAPALSGNLPELYSFTTAVPLMVRVDVLSTWNKAPSTLIVDSGALGASANGLKPSGSTTFWVTPDTCSDDPLTVKGALALFTKVPHVSRHKLFVMERVLAPLSNTPKALAFRFNVDPLLKLKSVPFLLAND
jgi:hypothetical protein